MISKVTYFPKKPLTLMQKIVLESREPYPTILEMQGSRLALAGRAEYLALTTVNFLEKYNYDFEPTN